MEVDAHDVLIEVDGPGVHPETVDTMLLLRLAEAYFRLLTKVSEAKKVGVSLVGLRIEDKCAAVVSRANNAYAARLVVDFATQIVSGEEVAPYGTEVAATDFRTWLRSLPEGMTAKARAGDWERPLQLREDRLRQFAWEDVELRVHVLAVGGVRPRAHFESDSEAKTFRLDVTEEEAQRLGKLLYQTVDIGARIVRDHNGDITDGNVVEVHALSDADASASWRSWFRRAGREWSGVSNVLEELGRDD